MIPYATYSKKKYMFRNILALWDSNLLAWQIVSTLNNLRCKCLMMSILWQTSVLKVHVYICEIFWIIVLHVQIKKHLVDGRVIKNCLWGILLFIVICYTLQTHLFIYLTYSVRILCLPSFGTISTTLGVYSIFNY